MNPFDTAAQVAFGITATAMGYDASWTPRGGGQTVTHRVLFREPTQKELLSGREYDETAHTMEYMLGQFPGLEEMANSEANEYEVITINGRQFSVEKVTRKWDGRTLRARLIPVQ